MRVVHVLPSLALGGAERLVCHLLATGLARGDEVWLLCVRGGGPLLKTLSPALRQRVRLLDCGPRVHPSNLARVRSAIRALRPDVVHTHLFTALAWGGVAAGLLELPWVHTQHSAQDDPEPVARWLRPLLLGRAQRVVCCSEAVLHYIRQRSRVAEERLVRVDNGVPIDVPRADLSGDPLQVVAVGSLIPCKGQRTLLSALALALGRGARLRLTVCGGGPELSSLLAQAEGLGISGVVDFAGEVEDVDRVLAASDLFVMPSWSEGLPMALLEACAAGLPLLVSSAGAAGPVEDSGGGWVVAPGDVAALADRLVSAAAMSPGQRRQLGARARGWAESCGSIERCAQGYAQLYREL